MTSRRRSRIRGVSVYQRGKTYTYSVELDPDPVTAKRRRQYGHGFKTEDAAWVEAIKVKSSVEQSRNVPVSRRTVDQFMTEWLEAIKDSIKLSTYTNYTDYLKAYVLPSIGRRRLQDVSVPVLNEFYRRLLASGRLKPDKNLIMYEYWLAHQTREHTPGPTEIARACGTTVHAARSAVIRYRRGRVPTRRDAGLAPKTVKNVHRMLHRALKDAVSWGYLSFNAAEHAALPRMVRKRPGSSKASHHVWTAEQLAAWLDVALNDRFAALWMTVASTGMRRSELAGLRRSSLRLDDGLIVTGDDTRIVVSGRAVDSDGKTDASGRVISLDPLTIQLLRQHVSMLDHERDEFREEYVDDDRLFCYVDGRAPHPDTITRMFYRLADKAGVPHIRLHDVRHTYATISLDAGVDLKIVSDRLGHANVYVTAQIYGHRSTGHDRAAAEQIAKLIRPITHSEND